MDEQPGVLEIRVHGVHGTSPQNMLGTKDVGQVAGDSITGFYRSKDGKLPNRKLPSNVAVEAYSWGTLTSGTKGVLGWLRRALWLFLLPFALANLAYWTRPCLNSGRRRRAVISAGVIRVGAMLLTLLFVVTACFVSIDLLAWQCLRGGTQSCPALPGPFDYFARDPMQALPRRLAVASFVPVAVIALLWVLSVRSTSRHENVSARRTTGARNMQRLLPGDEPIPAREAMWAGGPCVVRLRRLHLAFALLIVIGYSGMPLVRASMPAEETDGAGARALGTSAADSFPSWDTFVQVDAVLMMVGALVGVGLLVEVFLLRPGDVEYLDKAGNPVDPQTDSNRAIVLKSQRVAGGWLAVAAILLVGHLVLLFGAGSKGSGGFDESGDLFFHNVWFLGTFVALAVVGTIAFLVERAGRLGMAVGLVAMAAFVVGSALLSLAHLPKESAAQLWAAAMVVWLVGLVLHYGQFARVSGARRLAWGGAAPAVMFNAAAWVALLFTTAAVTLAADRLNGDLSVDDLKTHYGARPVSAFLANGDSTYILGGDIRLRGGIVAVAPEKVTIRSGTLTSDSLGRPTTAGPGAQQRKVANIGDAEVSDATLRLPADATLLLENSCLSNSTTSCDIEKGVDPSEGEGFLTSSSVDVSGASVAIAAGSNPVKLRDRSPPQSPIVLPQVLIWAPLGQFIWALLAAIVVALCWLRLGRRVRAPVQQVVTDDDAIARQDKDDCSNARLRAAFSHRAEKLLDVVGVVTVPVVLAVIAFSSTGRPPWQLVPGLGFMATVSMWFSLGLALLLVAMLSRMRTNPDSRKAVGILWDLTSFWPRAAHPFAPPCYAERVVPELLARVQWALRSPGSHVILSGHSQGSAIILAVTQRLGPDHSSRVRVITYGSQIRAWYGRIFPAVLGPDVLGTQPTKGPTTFGSPEPDAPMTTEPGGPEPIPPPMHLPWWNTADGQAQMCMHAGRQRSAEELRKERQAAQLRVEDLLASQHVAGERHDTVAHNPKRASHAELAQAQARLTELQAREDEAEGLAAESAHRLATIKAGDKLPAAATPWWLNLYRLSDPIGFRVFSDRHATSRPDTSNLDVYVQEVPTPDKGDPKPVVQGHSNFQHTAEYVRQVNAWYDEVPVEKDDRRRALPRAAFLDVPFFPDA